MEKVYEYETETWLGNKYHETIKVFCGYKLTISSPEGIVWGIPGKYLAEHGNETGPLHIEIAEGVTKICPHAFDSAKDSRVKIRNIKIPNSVTTIGDYAFRGQETLITAQIPAGVTMGKNVFAACGFTHLNIPEGVTKIPDGMFTGASNLSEVAFPQSLKRIGNHAFEWCHKLTRIKIPDSVTSIGDSAFSCCFGMKSITIPAGAACDPRAFMFSDAAICINGWPHCRTPQEQEEEA